MAGCNEGGQVAGLQLVFFVKTFPRFRAEDLVEAECVVLWHIMVAADAFENVFYSGIELGEKSGYRCFLTHRWLSCSNVCVQRYQLVYCALKSLQFKGHSQSVKIQGR
jgi:hypothetical protein